MSLSELIEALQIFRRYADPEHPTHCEHDELLICGIEPSLVSKDDRAKLEELGFFESDGGFTSLRYGRSP